MPFDAAPTAEVSLRVQKLQRLLDLLPRSGAQGSFSTCLWSEARKDPWLLGLGLQGSLMPMYVHVAQFFGLNPDDYEAHRLFGIKPASQKAFHLQQLIKEAEAQR